MPRFDRTGPRGMGPMTGRGMGSCNSDRKPLIPPISPTDYYVRMHGRPRWGLRYGGRGRGVGRGPSPYNYYW